MGRYTFSADFSEWVTKKTLVNYKTGAKPVEEWIEVEKQLKSHYVARFLIALVQGIEDGVNEVWHFFHSFIPNFFWRRYDLIQLKNVKRWHYADCDQRLEEAMTVILDEFVEMEDGHSCLQEAVRVYAGLQKAPEDLSTYGKDVLSVAKQIASAYEFFHVTRPKLQTDIERMENALFGMDSNEVEGCDFLSFLVSKHDTNSADLDRLHEMRASLEKKETDNFLKIVKYRRYFWD